MAAITSSVIGIGLGAFQTVKGISDSNSAKKAIENFQRQDISENPFANIQISTLKSEQQTDANLSSSATSVEALRRGGTRAVLGGIPKINENNILLQNIISADIDRQDKERQRLIARGDENIRAIRENRETRALAGLGQQLQSARQTAVNGVSTLVQSGLALSSTGFGNSNRESSGGVSSSVDSQIDFGAVNSAVNNTSNTSTIFDPVDNINIIDNSDIFDFSNNGLGNVTEALV